MSLVNRNMGILLLVTLGFLAIALSAEADETTTEALMLYDCKKIMGRIAKKMIKTFGICTKEVKANSTKEEFDKKMSCIIKCSMDRMLLTTPEGFVTKETIQTFMDSMIPAEVHELGHLLIEDCLAEHGAKLDKNQEYCESYGEFTQCMQNVLGDFADKSNCSPGMLGRK